MVHLPPCVQVSRRVWDDGLVPPDFTGSPGVNRPRLLGVFFGMGWTVCIGPTLSGVISLSVATDWNGSAWRGLFLILFYCAGLGVPFLLLALGFAWATTAVGVLRRHSRTIQVVGAVLLILVGVAMVTGLWGQFVAWLQVALVNEMTGIL